MGYTVILVQGFFFWGGGLSTGWAFVNHYDFFFVPMKYLSLYNFIYMHKVLNHWDFFKDKLCQILNTFIFL